MNIKSKLTILILVLSSSILLYGCGEQVCSYCGEEKKCKEYDILGTERFICADCMNNPNASSSGNVIWDYTSDLIDPSIYVPSINQTNEEDLENTDENEEEDLAAAIEKIMAEDIPEAITESLPAALPDDMQLPEITDVHQLGSVADSDNNISADNNDDTSANIQPSAKPTSTSLFDKLQTSLSADGYTLDMDTELKDTYRLYKNDNYEKVLFDFQVDDNGKKKLVISLEADGQQSAHTKACMNAILAAIDNPTATDIASDIYNNAYQYGNYNYGNNSFYYILSSQKEIENGYAPIRFEILYK